jgi:hypothetical protein
VILCFLVNIRIRFSTNQLIIDCSWFNCIQKFAIKKTKFIQDQEDSHTMTEVIVIFKIVNKNNTKREDLQMQF